MLNMFEFIVNIHSICEKQKLVTVTVINHDEFKHI